MNKAQKEDLLRYTCYTIEVFDGKEYRDEFKGVPQKLMKKLNKAMDLLAEVNEACSPKKRNERAQ